MATDTMATAHPTRLAELLADEDRSIRWLHRKTGINATRLSRMARGLSPMRVEDAVRIADALNRDPSIFLPTPPEGESS